MDIDNENDLCLDLLFDGKLNVNIPKYKKITIQQIKHKINRNINRISKRHGNSCHSNFRPFL